jgi:hypothetical protein
MFRYMIFEENCQYLQPVGLSAIMNSFPETALTILKEVSLTPTELIQSLLKSENSKVILHGIEYSVKGHVNIHLLAKTQTMDAPVSIFWISDH